MLDICRYFISKILIFLLFVYGIISGAIAIYLFFDYCDRSNLFNSWLIYQDPILLGLVLGSLIQIFAVICIYGIMFLRTPFTLSYVPTIWLLMGLSTGITIALYYLHGIVILIGFILPHAIVVLLPFFIVFLVGTDTMALLVFDSIKNLILCGILYFLDRLSIFL